jgi:hypothetical protein
LVLSRRISAQRKGIAAPRKEETMSRFAFSPAIRGCVLTGIFILIAVVLSSAIEAAATSLG